MGLTLHPHVHVIAPGSALVTCVARRDKSVR
jgi:hypothetical protein